MLRVSAAYAQLGRLEEARAKIFFDAETSGGLMLSIAEADAEDAVRRLREAGCATSAVIGQFGSGDQGAAVRFE